MDRAQFVHTACRQDQSGLPLWQVCHVGDAPIDSFSDALLDFPRCRYPSWTKWEVAS